MTVYRLLNNVSAYQNAYADFRGIRRQCGSLSVQFPQNNKSLRSKLNDTWQPVSVEFKAGTKNATLPDISTWNMSCLIMNNKVRDTLESMLEDHGELLPLQDGYHLFNCLKSVGGDTVDPSKTKVDLETMDSAHIPKDLAFLPDKIRGNVIFKPGFALNTFLICQDEFKNMVESSGLGGLIFEVDLSRGFPRG